MKPQESGKSQKLNFDASEVEKGTYQISWETISIDGLKSMGSIISLLVRKRQMSLIRRVHFIQMPFSGSDSFAFYYNLPYSY
ncbi:Uncharacterised protein [Staphylococcus delphini]|nr:Uncharacterised protein [Staphylococcus delphini]